MADTALVEIESSDAPVEFVPPKCEGARCSVCPLRNAPFVPPEANRNATVAVVGDFPQEYEVKEERPFMGPAGNEFTRYLDSEGLPRGHVHWTMTVLCAPPEGRMDRFLVSVKKRNKKIAKENKRRKEEGLEAVPLIPSPFECCAPRLQLEMAPFTNIIACGTVAAKSVIHKSATIMALRGAPTEIEKHGRMIRVMPTFHPGFMSKNKRWLHVWRQDIYRAAKWFRGELHWEKPQVWYHPTAEDLRGFLSNPDVPYWSYDVETDGIECLTANLRCIAIGTPKTVVVIGTLGVDGKALFYSPDEMTKVIAVLKEFFEDETKLKSGHNAGYYDYIVMREQLGIEVSPLIDTMLVHRLVESELPHNLGFVGSVYTEAPSWKTDREGRKKAYGSETDFELHEYCAYDVAVTAEVLPPLITKVKLRDQTKLMECDHKLQKICAEMHTVGMYVDQVRRLEYEKKFLREIHERRTKIRDMTEIKNLNPGSTMQLRDLLFERWRLDVPLDDKDRLTKAGDPSTSDHVLRALLTVRLTKEQRAAISEIRYYRRVQKLLGTYVTKLRYNNEEAWGGWDEGDEWMQKEWRERYGVKKLGIVDPRTGRMYPGYNAHITTSGRLSSSKPINAQNFPGGLRSMVTAAPGNVLVGADADQLELRIAASRWNSRKYLDAFRQGYDPHSTVTAHAVFGDRFVQAAMECGVGKPPWPTGTKFKGNAKKLRGLSKSVAYASQYWASVNTVHRVITQTEVDNGDGTTSLPYLRLSLREVRMMHEKWAEGAQYEQGWERELQEWRDNGFLEEPIMGRRRDFLDGENMNEIVNFPIQGAGASLMNIAIIDLAERIPLNKWGPGTGIINQCHDSLVVECPESEAQWVARQIEECMNLTHHALPGVEFTAESDIAMRWSEV
jgi:DNA polymerase I-like protein with 3'-5' exonuclease and polymerase domains/uracil-DNA glycosylase